jgi:uncharacterized protein YqeY
MNLKERINADFMLAFKSGNRAKKDVLGVIKGTIQTNEGKMIESTDENVLKVIKSIEKGINETLEGNKKMGIDTSEQEAELSFIAPYLPTLMSEDVIREKVRLIVSEATIKNVGALMGMFNKQNVGQAFDNKMVSKIITEELV